MADRVLRWLVVTPNVHRTHHSVDMDGRKTSTLDQFLHNLGAGIFGTYIDQPKMGVPNLVMGLPASERPARFTPLVLLLHPFRWEK
ncbi:MAG: hypothetical protein U5K75_03875 [Ahrensia sp.]|nr:hypothetical protein [Ahrensia sp.]